MITVIYTHRDGSKRDMRLSNESWIEMTGLHNFGLDFTMPVEIWEADSNDKLQMTKIILLDANGHKR
ncbi:MAG: hypothetical protein ACHQX3_00085 [Nitrospirales bacterium]